MKKAIIILLSLAVFGTIAVGVLMLLSGNDKKTTNPDVTPVSSTNPDTTIITNPDTNKPTTNTNKIDTSNYKYATIWSDNTIRLYKADGTEEIVNLNKKEWKDLRWSSEGSFLSVLEDTGDNVYDLWLYDFSTENWIKVTNYQDTGAGVLSYLWRDDLTILFTQGDPIIWLQQYYFPSGTEILKKKKLNAELISISSDLQKIVIKDLASDELSVINPSGDTIWNLQDLKSENGSELELNSLLFDTDSERVIIQGSSFAKLDTNSELPEIISDLQNNDDIIASETGDIDTDSNSEVTSPDQNINKLWKTLLNSDMAIEMKLENNIVPICSSNGGEFIATINDENNKVDSIISFNIEDEQVANILNREMAVYEQIFADSKNCTKDGNITFIIQDNGVNQWFLSSKEVESENITYLATAKEVALQPSY